MNRKGISQILFLIIAASVLMMVALTLIFMFQSSAGDTTAQAQTQTCTSSIQTKCSSFGESYVRMPSACFTTDDGTRKVLDAVTFEPVDDSGTTVNPDTYTNAIYADCP